eukprot:CAMPEP_0202919322 /NCGR_PEP_ID=MMETSP1392-20130828/75563_1 /ASSEMBLY_ACC=CAM_ASM_000868 /TAXON_ID=225041 /ORGANISM="Chlamydomonas chlamydogama, Strain SAG 11-48b" /LENGTH=147 /DNA_ID=CAMNT_0049612651 /DNA_START=224 /DNA_END=663 /DNA_ORIENTATION=-
MCWSRALELSNDLRQPGHAYPPLHAWPSADCTSLYLVSYCLARASAACARSNSERTLAAALLYELMKVCSRISRTCSLYPGGLAGVLAAATDEDGPADPDAAGTRDAAGPVPAEASASQVAAADVSALQMHASRSSKNTSSLGLHST